MEQRDAQRQFELLTNEISSIDGGVRSLDTVVFQVKNWAVTVAVASAGAALAVPSWHIAIVGLVATLLFWMVDAHYKSVQRVMIGCRKLLELRMKEHGLDRTLQITPLPLLQSALLYGEEFAFGDSTDLPATPSAGKQWMGHVKKLWGEALLPHTALLYASIVACQALVVVLAAAFPNGTTK